MTVDLSGFNLTNADWNGLNLGQESSVAGADFSGSALPRMSNEQLQSTDNWQNDSWSGVRFNVAQSAIDLTGRNLAGASFEGLNLSAYTFDDAVISGASFADAANIDAIKTSASFIERDLSGVDLSRVNDFRNRPSFDLRDFDLTGTTFIGSHFIRTDLRGSTGLEVEDAEVIFRHSILPDGTLTSFRDRGARYQIRNHPTPTQIVNDLSLAASVEIEILLDDEQFVPIVVDRVGVDLFGVGFESDVRIADWYGREIKLFDFVQGEGVRFFGEQVETLIWDASRLSSDGTLTLLGDRRVDADGNGRIDDRDVDRMCSNVVGNRFSEETDLNRDGLVNTQDLDFFWSISGVIPGDFDLNGTVDVQDFLTLSRNFGDNGRVFSRGNANCTGSVDVSDFLILSRNFGESTEYVYDWHGDSLLSAVPEPDYKPCWVVASLSLLVLRVRRSSTVSNRGRSS